MVGFGLLVRLALRQLGAGLDPPVWRHSWLAYLVVFGTTLLATSVVFVPVAVHTTIMFTAAMWWNPLLIALVASVGATLGETTGYFLGYLGNSRGMVERLPAYGRILGWVQRYGPFAVFAICLQPVLAFDIAGALAGASKMPLWKFYLGCWAGRVPRYVLVSYFGAGVLEYLSVRLPW
jgi:uncharacterized membrane protein YdjX (TVP38/TMEM64 family)